VAVAEQVSVAVDGATLSDGIEPFTTRFRVEFDDEADERT
jgi:hypothetical protein